MKNTRKPTLIGDLLTQADLVSVADLTDAVRVSQKTGLPVGRVLVANGMVSEPELQAGLKAQSLLRENLLVASQALQALKMVRSNGVDLDQALKFLGWRMEHYEFTNRLGQLLVDAGAVSKDQVDEALEVCFNSGLPVGRVLVLRGALSEFIAYSALTAQVLIRDGLIARDQAIGALRLTCMHGDSIETYLEFGGMRSMRSNVVRLGELLVLADLVSELDLLTAVEKGLSDELPIGQVLLGEKIINAETLECALKLQDMVKAERMRAEEAGTALGEIVRKKVPFDAAVQKYQSAPKEEALLPFNDLLAMLALVGLISQDDLKRAREIVGKGQQAGSILVERGFIDEDVLNVVIRCQEYAQAGHLSAEQCIFAVHNWIWAKGNFDDVLKRLGWLPKKN